MDVLVVANLDDSDEVLVLGAWCQCDSSLLFHYIFSDLIGNYLKDRFFNRILKVSIRS